MNQKIGLITKFDKSLYIPGNSLGLYYSCVKKIRISK